MIKHKWHIVSILLAMALVASSISSLFEEEKINAPTVVEINEEEVILNSIMTRSSVRNYTGVPVTNAQLETMLKAGMAAPTAGNRQPWRFYVVTNTEIIKQFTKVSKYTAPMNKGAKMAIIVCGVPSESFPYEPEYWVQDCSAATENILLSAHAQGLGAVWCGVFPGLDRVAALREIIDIPSELIPMNIIMVGNPDAEPKIKDKWKPERVHYIK